ncbi:MAG: PTS sugar transporter subunit IIA [Victivallaceae bacterium]|nr:PTS sugar transporter subunit IIA [Victivallaceae bacterium]
MDLKLKEVAKLLQVSEKTIYRWIQEEKIPYYRINHQYRFRTDDLHRWSLNNEKYRLAINSSKPVDEAPSSIETEPVSLFNNLKTGGIFYNITGSNVTAVLESAIEVINCPADLTRETILTKLNEREGMASTAIGDGIAFPHPRIPLIKNIADESVSLCFLHKPVDFSAIDNKPVEIMFIILSADQTRHLQLIAKLSYFCRQPEFIDLLKRQALREDLYKYLQAI